MERILSAVAMVNQAAAEAGVGVAGESLLGTIKIAVLPIAKVFTMCFLGFLMASKYVNILPASGRKLLNGVILVDPKISRLMLVVVVEYVMLILTYYLLTLQLRFTYQQI